jgi:hypothetical protein
MRAASLPAKITLSVSDPAAQALLRRLRADLEREQAATFSYAQIIALALKALENQRQNAAQ